ncbi:hypothetical protein SELMODRAFT_451298 [Selaginella moellendorffii]|uniref:Uncharacterized protein COP1L2-1 n=1 Tax=Selaginella moellendorffii TaxID=88036 RepID=D8RCY7_SELML|nr:hypothetical protein SELMODRAFT_451298 [Selaginella moellendorffii]
MPKGETATIADDSDPGKSKSCQEDPSLAPPPRDPPHPSPPLPAVALADLEKDLSCPVCFQTLRDPFLTACGHSFCYSCVSTHLNGRSSCPCCSSYLTTKLMYPNVLLGKVVRELQTLKSLTRGSPTENLRVALQHGAHDMSLKEIDFLLNLLSDRKMKAQHREAEENMDYLLEFFHELKRRKQLELDKVKEDMRALKNDLLSLRQERSQLQQQKKSYLTAFSGAKMSASSTSSGISQNSVAKLLQPTPKRRKAMVLIEQYDLFREIYIDEIRRCQSRGSYGSGLDTFRSVVSGFCRYSLDFDPGDEFFVTASVSGYLRVFEFPKAVRWSLVVWNPSLEIQTGKKLSCVSWDKFSKSCVATSDYDGIIKIWDISACQNTVNYDEHERRIWSVDFSPMEPSRLVSGGDDGKVKLWSKELKTSVLTVEVKANICSVTFNPISSNLVGAGSADHCIYYYDLRQTKCPLHLFKGHEKAVSYVKFTPSNEMVSASTDGTLRLWSLESWNTLQVYRGHTNEKNFVGLSVTSDYIACGSETNEVYVYHKGIPKPALSHLFARKDAADDDTRPFVSAVCWRRSDSHTMLAASSQGEIRALMLAS